MDFGFFDVSRKIFFEKMEMVNFSMMMNMIVIEKIIVIINNNNSLWALANYVLLYSKKIDNNNNRDPKGFIIQIHHARRAIKRCYYCPEGRPKAITAPASRTL